MRLAVVVVLLAGCRLNFLELGDDSQRDATTTDADADANIQFGPWSAPVLVAEVSSTVDPDDDPTLTADQLEMYIDSGRFVTGGASGDVWVATRASTSVPFNAPTVVNGFLSVYDDSTGDLSPDGLRFYLASDRQVSTDRDIYVSERANRQSPWGPLVRIPELAASQINDTGVCESADGLTLIFASERSGLGDLFFTTRSTIGSPWAPPQLVPGINTAEEESQHWCNANLTLIYFSRRNPTSGGGDLDIYFASRASPTAAFDPPQRVDELSTSADDADPWISPDLRTMYFYRATGSGDIYISTR